nr:ribonuclease H-like domain, reverse transcriptase, RNA-dependent DNA polymerase [Tanacetum cinerariifolium]
MKEIFEMSNLGLLAYYLGIKVTQSGGDISIKQCAYARKILKEAEMLESNETIIPMDPPLKEPCRFMQEPEEQHMKAIKKVLRYVKGTKDYGITYKHNGGNKIHGTATAATESTLKKEKELPA